MGKRHEHKVDIGETQKYQLSDALLIYKAWAEDVSLEGNLQMTETEDRYFRRRL